MGMPKVKKRQKRRAEESNYMDEKMNEPAAEEAGEAMPKCRKKMVGIILAVVAGGGGSCFNGRIFDAQ